MDYAYQDVQLPSEADRDALHGALATLTIGNADPSGMRGYLDSDFLRFLYTLAITPDVAGRALEIGSNPYFMTALLRMHRPGLALDGVNYFPSEPPTFQQDVRWVDGQQQWSEIFHSFNTNLEADQLPVEDGAYSVILFCEVLEHFTNDPMAALRELSRVLQPGGQLVLTTPNVARFDNVRAMLEGWSIYDPYSGYGPYGRHNREYTRHELHELMMHAGFEAEVSFTSDVHLNRGGKVADAVIVEFLRNTPNREHDLGQYLFTRWRKVREPSPGLPRWLYRSYPDAALA